MQSERYCGGLYDPDSGHLHPLNYTLGLARAAPAGVRIHEDSCVTRVRASRAGMVETSGGNVRARFVVLACNTFVGTLAPALSKKIMPVGTYVIATEPLGDARAAARSPARAAICDSRFVLDYFRPAPDTRLVWGGKGQLFDAGAARSRRGDARGHAERSRSWRT